MTNLVPPYEYEKTLPMALLYATSEEVLRGANSIQWSDDPILKLRNSAWQSLALRHRQYDKDYNESYIVYANLFNPHQSTAVIRAVQFDRKVARRLVRADPTAYVLKMAIRFVEIPILLLQNWLERLTEISVVTGKIGSNDGDSIRTLKIVVGIPSCSLEKTWRRNNDTVAELNQVWEATWLEIKTEVSQRPAVKYVGERYHHGQPKVTYDFDGFVI